MSRPVPTDVTIACAAILSTAVGCGTPSLKAEQKSPRQHPAAQSMGSITDRAPITASSVSKSLPSASLQDAAQSTDPQSAAFEDLAPFLAEACGAPVAVDFDDHLDGDELLGEIATGVVIVGGRAPLMVVRADRTFTPDRYENTADPAAYRLHATSGEMILSPGGIELGPGPDPQLEDDDVTLIFDPPVAAVGFDLLLPSLDGMSFVDVVVIAVDGEILHSGGIHVPRADAERTSFPPSGAAFWGYVADGCRISEVRLDERDEDPVCPDANIGLDSIRIAPGPSRLAADLDGDGWVTRADIELFSLHRSERDASPAASRRWWPGDIDRDGRVDADDLMIIVTCLGQ